MRCSGLGCNSHITIELCFLPYQHVSSLDDYKSIDPLDWDGHGRTFIVIFSV